MDIRSKQRFDCTWRWTYEVSYPPQLPLCTGQSYLVIAGSAWHHSRCCIYLIKNTPKSLLQLEWRISRVSLIQQDVKQDVIDRYYLLGFCGSPALRSLSPPRALPPSEEPSSLVDITTYKGTTIKNNKS